jgi:carboxymethylenebutenolidase
MLKNKYKLMEFKLMDQAANDRSYQGINSRWVAVEVNGDRMQAYLACPSGLGPWPAVIVLMEIFGVNSHIRSVTERLAAEGYVAIAPNYYHRSTNNLELGYSESDMAQGWAHKNQTTREGLLIDIRATIQFLQAQKNVEPKDKMACIGFCFGGHAAFIAASIKEVAVTASFYPGGVATSAPGDGEPTVTHSQEIDGEILCLFGENDTLIPHVDTVTIETALQQAGVRHEIIRYGNTGHGFFCDQRESYDPSAAEDAWVRVKALFHKGLFPQPAIASPDNAQGNP